MTAASPPPLPVILNPTARHGEVGRRIGPMKAAFARRSLQVEVVESRSEAHAGELAAEFAGRGAPLVVSLGGDGLVRAVGAGLVGTQTSLAIIAGGRGNDFIAKLGIPKDVEAAVSTIADGYDLAIDTLDLDGLICVGNVSLGLDTTVQDYADSTRRIKGHWVYLYGLIRAIRRPTPIDLVLTVDGERRGFHGLSAGFANSGRYGGGLKLSPDAQVDDGLIDVVLFEDTLVPRLAAELVSFMLVRLGWHPHISLSHATEIRIDTPPGVDPVVIMADGDAVARTPATLTIRPASLKVRVPQDRRA